MTTTTLHTTNNATITRYIQSGVYRYEVRVGSKQMYFGKDAAKAHAIYNASK